MSVVLRYAVTIDRRTCVGTTNCAEAAPGAYRVDEHCNPHLVPEASPEELLAGAEACPVCAIIVTDTLTGRQVYP